MHTYEQKERAILSEDRRGATGPLATKSRKDHELSGYEKTAISSKRGSPGEGSLKRLLESSNGPQATTPKA